MLFVSDYKIESPGIALDVSVHGVGSSISNEVPTNNATNVFDYVLVKEIPLTCSNTSMLCTVSADFGY